jgi:hypothetical protein
VYGASAQQVNGDLEGHVVESGEGGFVVYDGFYQASRRHGLGTLNFRDGSRIEGVWENGCVREKGFPLSLLSLYSIPPLSLRFLSLSPPPLSLLPYTLIQW